MFSTLSKKKKTSLEPNSLFAIASTLTNPEILLSSKSQYNVVAKIIIQLTFHKTTNSKGDQNLKVFADNKMDLTKESKFAMGRVKNIV